MKFIVGEKLGMTQVFDKNGNVVPVTLVYARRNVVTQVRTKERDGYAAVQVGYGETKRTPKPQAGHLKELGKTKTFREFRGTPNVERGVELDLAQFQAGDLVKVTGISKSKGFQGVVKRHGFHGAPATHGTKHAHREPGSIGATWPQRVIKGMRMAGRMGGDQVSLRNLEVIEVQADKGLIALRGAIPGKPGSLVEIAAQ